MLKKLLLLVMPKLDRITKKILVASTKIPFIDDVISLYYCAIDDETPSKVKLAVIGTLLYLVMPLDFIPDFLVVIGYSDDITALAVLYSLVSPYIKDNHKKLAQEKLAEIRQKAAKDEIDNVVGAG